MASSLLDFLGVSAACSVVACVCWDLLSHGRDWAVLVLHIHLLITLFIANIQINQIKNVVSSGTYLPASSSLASMLSAFLSSLHPKTVLMATVLSGCHS